MSTELMAWNVWQKAPLSYSFSYYNVNIPKEEQQHFCSAISEAHK